MATEENETEQTDADILLWRKWSAGTTLAALGDIHGENLFECREIEVNYCIFSAIVGNRELYIT